MIETIVLIAEYGARWDVIAPKLCAPHRQLVVILQQARESSHSLRQRVEELLERLEHQRVNVAQLVVFEGPRSDGAALLSRAQTVRALATRLAHTGRDTRVSVYTSSTDAPALRCTRALLEAVAVALGPVRVRLELAMQQPLANAKYEFSH